jgi:cytochrome c oxidase subunit I
MATITADAGIDYLTSENTVRSWLFTRDHKRIGLLFFGSITFFFFIGGIAATLMRLHLATPEGLLQPSIYNRMFTMHGVAWCGSF